MWDIFGDWVVPLSLSLLTTIGTVGIVYIAYMAVKESLK